MKRALLAHWQGAIWYWIWVALGAGEQIDTWPQSRASDFRSTLRLASRAAAARERVSSADESSIIIILILTFALWHWRSLASGLNRSRLRRDSRALLLSVTLNLVRFALGEAAGVHSPEVLRGSFSRAR